MRLCVPVCVCVSASGERGPAGPQPLLPLSRRLQELLRAWRLPVPQPPGSAVLQVKYHWDVRRGGPFLWFGLGNVHVLRTGYQISKRGSASLFLPSGHWRYCSQKLQHTTKLKRVD